MRRFLLAAVMCGMTAGAQAADLSDLPILRGGLTEGTGGRVNWSGVYVGGQVVVGVFVKRIDANTVELRSQQFARIIVRLDRVDAMALS